MIVEIAMAGINQDVGVIVGAVNAVLEILGSEIAPSPTLAARIRTDFNCGMGKVSGKFVAILDADQLCSCGDLEAVHIGGALAGRIAGKVSTGATL